MDSRLIMSLRLLQWACTTRQLYQYLNVQYMGLAMPAGLCIFVGMLASLHRLWKLDLSEVTFQSLESLENLLKK